MPRKPQLKIYRIKWPNQIVALIVDATSKAGARARAVEASQEELPPGTHGC